MRTNINAQMLRWKQSNICWIKTSSSLSSISLYLSKLAVNALQYIATHCNTLRHTATHCNTLQHTCCTHVAARCHQAPCLLHLKSISTDSFEYIRTITDARIFTFRLSNICSITTSSSISSQPPCVIEMKSFSTDSFDHTRTNCDQMNVCSRFDRKRKHPSVSV